MSEPTRCRVCGQDTPPGHKVCDTCWPERAVAEAIARRCDGCGAPKLIERLTLVGDPPYLACGTCRGT